MTARRTLWRRLWAESRGHRPHIAALFALELASTPLALLAPVPLKIAVDSALGGRPVPGFVDWLLPDVATRSSTGILVSAAILILAIGFFDHIRGLLSWVLGTYTGERISLQVRSRLFRHVQRMSLAYHDTHGTSDSTYRIQYDAGAISSLTTEGLTPFLTAGITLLAMLFVTAQLDWQLALAAVVVAPVLVVISGSYRKKLRRGWSEVKAVDSAAMSVVQETLSALRVVKALGREQAREEQYLQQARTSMRGHVRMALLEGGLWVVVGMTLLCGMAAVLFLGVRHVQAGTLTLGELLVVMAYMANINGPLETLTRHAGDLQSSLASAERAFALLDEAPDVPERPDAVAISGRATGAISFEKVFFSYGISQQGLRDVSFVADPGTCVGIAGATGAGKTTLTSLLCRFYDPESGRILFDGTDMRDYRVADLRDQFAIVLQDPVLFTATVAENIAYAAPDSSLDQIVEAAKAADAHDFILELAAGYDTAVGERGMTLSGGQRQRLSLARAFLKNAPVLILDEPTSAVDRETEQSIMRSMRQLMEGRTTFLVSHRPSLLELCDSVVHLRAGRVVQVEVITGASGQALAGG